MKLLIISHMPHFLGKDGEIRGWGPTVQEINFLAQLFTSIRHIAPLHSGQAAEAYIPYDKKNIELLPVAPAGGEDWVSKFGILLKFPSYLSKILSELKSADVVHVRCPANISLLAIVVLRFVKYPRLRWVKYAGNWQPDSKEGFSYKFQRWWLTKNFHRGMVTINGSWPGQPPHVLSFYNPCLTSEDRSEGEECGKLKQLKSPYQILFVGVLEPHKGIGHVIEIAKRLKQKGLPFELHIVGDGSQRSLAQKNAEEFGLKDTVVFHGWKPKTEIKNFYKKAHFLLCPSISEGWPKVISEGMAYGVVPLASHVSSIPQHLETFQTGRTFDPDNIEGFVDALCVYVSRSDLWKSEALKAVMASEKFTYEKYLEAIVDLLAASRR